jgi:hypothetical protein
MAGVFPESDWDYNSVLSLNRNHHPDGQGTLLVFPVLLALLVFIRRKKKTTRPIILTDKVPCLFSLAANPIIIQTRKDSKLQQKFAQVLLYYWDLRCWWG